MIEARSRPITNNCVRWLGLPDHPPSLQNMERVTQKCGAERAIRYALSIPGIAVAVIGLENIAEIEKAATVVARSNPLSPEESLDLARIGLDLAGTPEWKTAYGTPLVIGSQTMLPGIWTAPQEIPLVLNFPAGASRGPIDSRQPDWAH